MHVLLPEGDADAPDIVRSSTDRRSSVGMSDGAMSEVLGDDVKEGLEVVVSEDWQSGAPQGAAASPFVPQIRR
jgi:hypothetical protein